MQGLQPSHGQEGPQRLQTPYSLQFLATLRCGISCSEKFVQAVDDIGHTAFVDQDPMQ